MEYLIGNQRLTTVGNLLPTATPIRIFSVDAHSTTSSSSLTLHNGLVSSTTTTIYLVYGSDGQGNIHEYGMDTYFPDGVWIDTGCAGTVTTLIGYSAVRG